MGTLTILRLRRLITGIPQTTLAAAAGHSQAWYSRLELGEPGAAATVRDSEKIAAVFGVPAGKLFTSAGDPLRRAAA